MSRRHQVFIFRHGETDWNREGRFQGHIDVQMNETGRAQARALVERLRPRRLQAILSSDLSRARETAEIVAGPLGLAVHVDARLREAFLGEAQGLRHEEIEARFGGEAVRRWRSHLPTDADASYPGGESGSAIMARAFAAMEDFLAARPELERIGIATHGGVIRRVIQKITGGEDSIPIPNGVLYSLSYVSRDRIWTLDTCNGDSP